MKSIVTVLMPVYNAEKYLSEAIESILNQTYKNFDFLIINDGSTDSSLNIIESYAKNDSRIKIISRENKGLIATLNEGLDIIETKYIARMDADDISLPKRLEKQVKFMDENRDIVVCGAKMKVFGDNIRSFIPKIPLSPKEIKMHLYIECCLVHPTVLVRTAIIKEENYRYNPEHKTLEDYGLWQLISKKYGLANIDEVLLKYRIIETSITQVAEKDIKKRDEVHMKIYKQAFENTNIPEFDYRVLRRFISNKEIISIEEIKTIKAIIDKLNNENKFDYEEHKIFDKYIARKILNTLGKDVLNGYRNNIKYKDLTSKKYYKFNFFSKYWILQNIDNLFLYILLKMLIVIKYNLIKK